MDLNVEGVSEGKIRLNDLIISGVSFKRERDIQNIQLELRVGHRFFKTESGEDVAELILDIKDKNDNEGRLDLKVTACGFFSVNAEDKTDYRPNMLAIIFPYIRSQITLITAQPNMEPIVLPTVNINEFLKNKKAGGD